MRHIRVIQSVPVSSLALPAGTVSIEDAAAYLGVARETVRRCVNQGLLAAERHENTPGRQGWRWQISTDELMRFKDSRSRREALENVS